VGNSELFGSKLREYRKESNLTLVQLSELTGISQSYLSQIETGKAGIPSPDMLRRLADGLSYPATYAALLHDAGYEELAKAVKWQEVVDAFGDVDFEGVEEDKKNNDNDVRLRGLRDQVQFINHVTDIKTFIEHNYNPKHLGPPEESLALSIAPNYNGHPLTDQDRQRILDMFKALFPEYQSPGTQN